MQTRTRHTLSPETVKRLTETKNGATWREFARALQYDESYAATLNKAAHGTPGAMTLQAENILRVRLGLAPVHMIEVPTCPDCGMAHTGRCFGKPVIQVVVLSNEERVVRKGKPRSRKRYHRPCMDDAEYALYLEWRASRV